MPIDIVPVRALSPTDILTGNRNTKYYLDILDPNDSFKFRLDGVDSGELNWTANASIKGAGSLVVKDVNQNVDWLNDRIRPIMAIKGLPEQPLGIFLPSEAPDSWDRGHSWALKLLDKTTILDTDIFTSTYSLAAGTVVTTQIITLITDAGITNYAVTASAATLPGALSWKAGTSRLQIINDLLSLIGYFSLYCNFNGQIVAEPYVLPAKRPIVYEFIDGPTSIYRPDFTRDRDLRIPNRVVIVGQGDGTTPALTSSVDNTNPNSPYSIANRGGRILGYSEEGVEAADQATLDAYAKRRLVELTTPVASIEVYHAPVPGLAVNNTVRFRRVPAGIDARHTVALTRLVLKGKALAQSTFREVVDL